MLVNIRVMLLHDDLIIDFLMSTVMMYPDVHHQECVSLSLCVCMCVFVSVDGVPCKSSPVQ